MLRCYAEETRSEFLENQYLQTKRKEVRTVDTKHPSLLDRLFEPVPETPAAELGSYDPNTQTWSHRDACLMSPVKHNQEH